MNVCKVIVFGAIGLKKLSEEEKYTPNPVNYCDLFCRSGVEASLFSSPVFPSLG